METKELKINIPEGYEIDEEKSTLLNIVFKPIQKPLTYNDVANKLFKNKKTYFLNCHGVASFTYVADINMWNNCTTPHQLEWLIAINKFQNVATYLNDGWKLDLNNSGDTRKWYIGYDLATCKLFITCSRSNQYTPIVFKSEKIAEQAIEILGEKMVKTALGFYKD